MSRHVFDCVIDWDFHPQVILCLGFVVAYYLMGSGLSLATLIAAAFAMPFLAVLLFIPYLVVVVIVAACLAGLPTSSSARPR